VNQQAQRTAVFIDGAHFTKALRPSFDRICIAYARLSEMLVGPGTLLRTYYYDALPYSPPRPTEEDLSLLGAKRRFFNALRREPKIMVREGRTARSWDRLRGEFVYEQKFVDVLLAVDLVSLSAKQRIDVAVLITGDSDFVPAVEAAKSEGVQVRLVCAPEKRDVHRDLLTAVDEVVVLDAAMVEAVRMRRRPDNDNGAMSPPTNNNKAGTQ
jgi:uncharacterized LabA/DUF88 family protein